MSQRNLILFDDEAWTGLLPLTWLRPVAELRLGILTMRERWERLLDGVGSQMTQDYLAGGFPLHVAEDNFFVNGSVLPTDELVEAILALERGHAITYRDELLAARLDRQAIEHIGGEGEADSIPGAEYTADITLLRRPYDLFTHNGAMLAHDFALVTAGRTSEPISSTNTVLGSHPVFLEPGARCEAAVLNATDGPIYLGRAAQVSEGSLLRGPVAVCEGAIVKMGARVYPDTTIGPNCRAGGELNNVVMQGNCNKGHDGFLGNAVIGQWCNLGADTNASNLKNTYGDVRVWDYRLEAFAPSGLQFCGLIMGDHAKCGINTMFNTGTVVGVGANVFGDGFPRAFVPDFAWGGAAGMQTFRLERMLETAERVYARRGMELSAEERTAIETCFGLTAEHRRWESRDATAAAPSGDTADARP